jgi:hypothetical protein
MIESKREYEPKVSAIHRLRVNVKSLAAESRIIRQEERRCGGAYRDELSLHRRGRLREESRYAQLALAFVRGRAYKTVEREAYGVPQPSRLVNKVKQFTGGYLTPVVLEGEIGRWLNAG